MDHETLLSRLRRIEALHAGTHSEGEREAAEKAMQRIRERLARTAKADPPVEYSFSLPDPWTRKLFVALCRRYGLIPFRRYRQHRQTVMLRVPRGFVDETLWPEFQALSEELRSYLEGVTDRVIHDAINEDTSDATEEPKALAAPRR